MKCFTISVAIIVLTACSVIDKQEKSPTIIDLRAPVKETIVVIYNHGTRNPRKKERCNASYNRIPQSLLELESERLQIYFLCSGATEGQGREHAGNQIYARMYEIEQTVDALIKQGIKPEHIFLAGHSKGAWASLMLMNMVDKKFNAAILFAPALANRASERNFPWWRQEVRPKQIQQMLQAEKIDALIFAYEDDEYNRPQDLEFLIEKYPQSAKIVAYRCEYKYTHNTHLNDCRHVPNTALIAKYIDQQIAETQ